ITKASLVPEDNTDNATPPAAAALFTFNPVALEAVEASILNAGLVAPDLPPVKALAEELVIVEVKGTEPRIVVPAGITTIPVAVPLIVTVPEPLASMVKFSLVP